MTLHEDFKFDSLGAIREEIREWLGPESLAPHDHARHSAARDVLISVLIHSLADELSDVRVRAQIHALLADFSQNAGERFAD